MRNSATALLICVSLAFLIPMSGCGVSKDSAFNWGMAPPADAAVYNGHHYKVIAEHATWHVAKARCEAMGGHLVTITSAAEDDFVRALCKGEDVWLGASDEEKEGDWKWVTGEAFAFKHWATGQPDNDQGTQHHLVYSHGEAWDDNNAGIRWKYMCEWDK